MATLNVSAAHSLRLIPISKIAVFAKVKTGVKMVFLGNTEESFAIPGTIQVTTSEDNGIIKKSISYKRRNVTHESSLTLERYKADRLVAIYIDETGNKRVAGSPSYPLSFSYTSGEGVFSCSLEGEDLTIDPFVI